MNFDTSFKLSNDTTPEGAAPLRIHFNCKEHLAGKFFAIVVDKDGQNVEKSPGTVVWNGGFKLLFPFLDHFFEGFQDAAKLEKKG